MITEEGARLGQHWNRIGADQLDRYLVQDVEHPAFNAQSVLIRSFIIDRFFPGEATDLIEAELYYSACASFALYRNRKKDFASLHQAVQGKPSEFELPPFLEQGFRDPYSRYFEVAELYDEIANCLSTGFDHFSSPFEMVWRDFLKGREFRQCRLIELACGSANDYRMWDACGVAALLDYTGIDISSANIANARKRFPDVNFAVGDICLIAADDQSHDVSVAFDVYEHLSPPSVISALEETLRVARDECWISFFNVADRPEHKFVEVGDYHWNLLSIPLIAEEVRASGFDVEIFSVPGILEAKFEGYRHYNREAHLLAATRNPAAAIV